MNSTPARSSAFWIASGVGGPERQHTRLEIQISRLGTLKNRIGLHFREHVPFIPALPAHRVIKAPTGERWIHEIKHDGFRLIARRVGTPVKLYTRRESD